MRTGKVLAASLLSMCLTAAAGCTPSGTKATSEGSAAVTIGWHEVHNGEEVPLPPGKPLTDAEWDPDTTWRLVNFWASTCGPCKKEIPVLNRAAGIDDLQVLGVSRDQFRKYARKFEDDTGATFPSWMDSEGDFHHQFTSTVPIQALPVSLLSRDGKLVAVHIGPIDDLSGISEQMSR